jgi:hypothetical protein
MTSFEVLVEGSSDVPTIREILTRRFGMAEGPDFRIHPHHGKGSLPANSLARPDPRQKTLLHQLPAKLRGYSHYLGDVCVLVVIDLDNDKSDELLESLQQMLISLPKRPKRVLFRLAVEETESWFIADVSAVGLAFPGAKLQRIKGIEPDKVVGAWEYLAEAIGVSKDKVTGADKTFWATKIAPHLDLNLPRSPSLGELISGVEVEIGGNPA